MHHIIITGWNCEQYAEQCLRSVVQQHVPFKIVLVNDGSTDKTHSICQRYKRTYPDKIDYMMSTKNRGAAYSRWIALQHINPEPSDVIVLVDLDDYLTKDALTHVDDAYQDGAWVTFGRHQRDDGKIGPYREYTDGDLERIRTARWKAFPLRTFRGHLLQYVKRAHFIKNGHWIQTATDVALIIPLIERVPSADLIHHLKEITYVFRQREESAMNRYGWDGKKEVSQWVREGQPV